MSASKVIKQIMLETDTSVKDLASMLGMKSSQVLSNKLYRDTFTFDDYINIVGLMGCTVHTVVSSSGKIFVNGNVPADTAQAPEMPRAAANAARAGKSPSRAEKTLSPAAPPSPAPKTEKRYKPFTKKAEGKIDLKELLTNIQYQISIGTEYGTEVLAVLLDKARKEMAEPEGGSRETGNAMQQENNGSGIPDNDMQQEQETGELSEEELQEFKLREERTNSEWRQIIKDTMEKNNRPW